MLNLNLGTCLRIFNRLSVPFDNRMRKEQIFKNITSATICFVYYKRALGRSQSVKILRMTSRFNLMKNTKAEFQLFRNKFFINFQLRYSFSTGSYSKSSIILKLVTGTFIIRLITNEITIVNI